MEIPALWYDRTVGTYVEGMGREGKDRCKRSKGRRGKTLLQPKGVKRSEIRVAKHVSHVPRKAAIVHTVPVPKTDTGGWGENPKAGGRSIVKELGKMTP